jgi:hypothetical protein
VVRGHRHSAELAVAGPAATSTTCTGRGDDGSRVGRILELRVTT